MEPLGIQTAEVKDSKTSLLDQESPDDLFDETEKTATIFPTSDDLLLSDHSGDTFTPSHLTGDPSLSSSKGHDLFFNLDQGHEDFFRDATWSREDSTTLTNLEKAAREVISNTSSSLFEGLLDFSSPGTSEIDQILQDNMTDSKPVPKVDLLFGVDDDLVSPGSFQSEVKAKNPDILDFMDAPSGLPEVSSMDVTDSLTCEPLSGDWNLVTAVALLKPAMEQSPDIIVALSELNTDFDAVDDHAMKNGQEKEKTDDNIKEKMIEKAKIEDISNKTDDIKVNINNQEFDFSVLEFPEASHLNFDHFKHKRNISQKGSIANRKKPKRATIQPHSEDSIFLDSTEPKPHKLQVEDELDSGLSPDHNRGKESQEADSGLSPNINRRDKPQEADSELSPNHSRGDKPQDADGEHSEETSPSRKLAGGIKIPGLLEGLSKSKAFNRVDKKSPEPEPDSVPQVTSQVFALEIDKSPASLQAASSPPVTSSPPVVRQKPMVLPRVLPKPTTKILKETQNLTTAGGGVVRASSFRITSSVSVVSEQPSFLKSPSTISRSASVKVTGALGNKDLEQSALKEQKTPAFGVSKLVPPKPDLKKPLCPAALKPVNKAPPPVPAKPSVANKPSRASFGLSASFSGGRSPLLPVLKSETRTEFTSIAKQKPDSGIALNVEKKTELASAINTEKKPVSDVTVSFDNKSVSSSSSRDSKPLSFAQKNTVVHSTTATPEKVETGIKSVKSASGEFETSKNITVSRIPSLKKPLHSGFVAKSGFKAGESYTKLEAKKTEKLDEDDVFATGSSTADKTGTSVNIPNSSKPDEKLESSNAADEYIQHRKSSISGVTPVKSPLTCDKPPSSGVPRKGSISGSAYNPLGFRSTLGSSDSEQRSRGNSFSSSIDCVDSVNILPSVTASSPKPRADSYGSHADPRSRDGSFNTSTSGKVRYSPEKAVESGPGEANAKPGTLSEDRLSTSFASKGGDEKRKKATNEINSDIQEQSKIVRESGTVNGSPDVTKGGVVSDRKSSPWNVQLKKVDKKETQKPEPASKTEDSQPANWRQQLSLKQRSSFPPKDAEKPKQDSTPEWAKASLRRRQRLIESGVIRGDS